jgi:hypothetical protein
MSGLGRQLRRWTTRTGGSGAVAPPAGAAHNRGVGNWGSYSFLFGPVLALMALGGLALVARWASQSGTSLIETPARQGTAEEYGLMIPVASPPSSRASHDVANRLTSAGVRCREVDTVDGPRVMVWAEDVARARAVLDSPR